MLISVKGKPLDQIAQVILQPDEQLIIPAGSEVIIPTEVQGQTAQNRGSIGNFFKKLKKEAKKVVDKLVCQRSDNNIPNESQVIIPAGSQILIPVNAQGQASREKSIPIPDPVVTAGILVAQELVCRSSEDPISTVAQGQSIIPNGIAGGKNKQMLSNLA